MLLTCRENKIIFLGKLEILVDQNMVETKLLNRILLKYRFNRRVDNRIIVIGGKCGFRGCQFSATKHKNLLLFNNGHGDNNLYFLPRKV